MNAIETQFEVESTPTFNAQSPIRSGALQSWLCLIAAGALLLVSDGRDTASLAVWPAQVLLLRFLRTQPIFRGLLAVYLLKLIVLPIAYRGMIPIPVPFYYFYLVISGLSSLLPYALDRWLSPRLAGMANTLVFPAALTVSQWVYGKGPVGSWGSIAYTQTGNLGLEQLVSVTGLAGIVFLIGWFASSVNLAWQTRDARRLIPWTAAMAAALLGGQLRLAAFPPSEPTVRVASLSKTRAIADPSDALAARVVAAQATPAEIDHFRSTNRALNDDLLTRAEREARAGAKIVFWAEGNATVLLEDEPDLIARGRQLAQRYGIYLGMALYTWTPGAPKPMQNKMVMIAPDGSVAWQYWKVHPTPGPENNASVVADGQLKTLDTPYGRIAAAICYDMDFPALLAQAGAARVDLVLSPANDWRAVDPRHTEIAAFRAIEQGFNLARQSSGGLSAAFDYQGRSLAMVHAYASGDDTLVVNLPTHGVRTLYSVLGDWLVWASLAGLLLLLAMGWRRKLPALASA